MTDHNRQCDSKSGALIEQQHTERSQELGSNPKTQFTEGPWLTDEDGAWIRQGTDAHAVWVAFTCEQLGSSFGKVQKANAHLISAAPEMYEALYELAQNGFGASATVEFARKVNAAIAKAEGRAA